MTLLSLQSVCKKFGRQPVLHDLCLKIAEHERVVLFGPSGCGKTTTLRLIVGLDRPDSGEIRWNGSAVNSLAAKDRSIAIVLQSGGYYDHMHVYDNLDIPLKSFSISKSERDRRIHEIAELLELSPHLRKKPTELSGGQLQRLALGRALVRDCQLLLLDEPLSHLDWKLRHRLRQELLLIQSRLRFAMLYVTHDPAEAMMMADRVAVMEQGKIIQIDTPKRLYERPKYLSTASSVGWPPMHFTRGQLKVLNEQLQLAVYGTTVLLSRAAIEDQTFENLKHLALTVDCEVGIRPEDWHPAPTETEDDRSLPTVTPSNLILQGTIRQSDFMGLGWLHYLVDEANTTVVWFQSRTAHAKDLHLRSNIRLQVMPECLHLFDRTTGARL